MARLTQHALKAVRPRHRQVEGLSRRLPRVGLAGVLADLDSDALPCEVPGEAAGDGFTWNPADRGDRAWWPQGVACARGSDVLLVSWYAKRQRFGRPKGSRISVVDRTDATHPRYRHVLLVSARRRPLLSMGVVPVHAGGIAVLGDLLYVADTLAGVRVFRLSDVMRVPGPGHGGCSYVLPQLLTLRVPVSGTGKLLYSFLSVGQVEGQLSLVVGEYRRKGSSPRLLRYPLDPETGLPLPGKDGRCAPAAFYDAQPPRMQGVAVDGDTWYLSASTGEDKLGDLHVGAPGAFRRHRGVLPTGCEDLDWSRPGQELWCVSEWPDRRWVFPVDVTRWAAPPREPGRRTGTGR